MTRMRYGAVMERIDGILPQVPGSGDHGAGPGERPGGGPGTSAEAEPSRRLGLGWWWLMGLGAAVAGLLPWVITGMRLPLQNLWAVQVPPDEMPIALLPFSQYAISLIVAILVMGYATAGIVARAMRDRRPRGAVVALGLGVVAVHLIATVQTTIVVTEGVVRKAASQLYVLGLAGGIVATILLGVLVLWLVARAPVPGAVMALSLSAVVAGSWFSGLILPLGSVPTEASSLLVTSVLRWLPAVLVGVAIAWGGVGTVGRVVGAACGLLILWIVPAVFTALGASLGSRVLLPYPAELLDYGLGVLRLALLQPEVVLPPVVVAVITAAAGLLVRRMFIGQRAAASALAPRTNADGQEPQ